MDKTKNLMDFMNAFIDKPAADLNETHLKIEKQYEELFGHSVPREMLPISISEDEILAALKKCIETKSDTLFETLGVKINYDHLY